MNNNLQNYARSTLKEWLKECTPDQQHIFRRMYSHKNLEKPIDEVVDEIPEEKLDWAMQQVERTIKKK